MVTGGSKKRIQREEKAMLSTPQWITFWVSIVFILWGLGLMAYGALQNRGKGGVSINKDWIQSIAPILNALYSFVSPSRAASIGAAVVLFGILIMVLTFVLVPGPIVPSPVS